MNDYHVGGLHRRTYAEIDLNCLAQNFHALRESISPQSFFCPMVKANAYGHGDIEVSQTLRSEGATHLGVGLIEEGVRLRHSGDTGGLLLFGIFDKASTSTVIEHKLTPVISQQHELENLVSELYDRQSLTKFTHSSAPFKIHLKFNTGMNRLGFDVDQAPQLRVWLDKHPQLSLEGVCTHLLRGDDAGDQAGESHSQLQMFTKALESFSDMAISAHVLNSSGLANMLSQQSEGGVVSWGARPGLAVYGGQPSNDHSFALPIRPVMSLKTHIVMVHRLRHGERVSYNATWRAERDSLIAVLPLGYADGYFRGLSNKGHVLCKGIRAPIVGTICMDYFMVDVTEVEHLAGQIIEGEEVVLIGEQSGKAGLGHISADDVSKWAGTIPYEVMTNVSERVPRVYLR
jgi:alanine racemase